MDESIEALASRLTAGGGEEPVENLALRLMDPDTAPELEEDEPRDPRGAPDWVPPAFTQDPETGAIQYETPFDASKLANRMSKDERKAVRRGGMPALATALEREQQGWSRITSYIDDEGAIDFEGIMGDPDAYRYAYKRGLLNSPDFSFFGAAWDMAKSVVKGAGDLTGATAATAPDRYSRDPERREWGGDVMSGIAASAIVEFEQDAMAISQGSLLLASKPFQTEDEEIEAFRQFTQMNMEIAQKADEVRKTMSELTGVDQDIFEDAGLFLSVIVGPEDIVMAGTGGLVAAGGTKAFRTLKLFNQAGIEALQRAAAEVAAKSARVSAMAQGPAKIAAETALAAEKEGVIKLARQTLAPGAVARGLSEAKSMAISGAGKTLTTAGKAAEYVERLPGRALGRLVTDPETRKLVESRLPGMTVGGAIGGAIGASAPGEGANPLTRTLTGAVGAVTGATLPFALQRSGTFMSNVAALRRAGELQTPFWKRMRKVYGDVGIESSVAGFLDNFHFYTDPFTHYAGRVGRGLVGGTAAGYGLGYVAGGGSHEAAMQQAAVGLGLSYISAPFGAFFPVKDATDAITQNIAERDQLFQLWDAAGDKSSREQFEKLDVGSQLALAHYLHVTPEIDITVAGSGDRIETGGQTKSRFSTAGMQWVNPATGRSHIALNRGAKTSDLVKFVASHEIVHDATMRGLKPTILNRLIGNADAGIVGTYSRVREDGTLERTPEFESLRKDYTSKVQINMLAPLIQAVRQQEKTTDGAQKLNAREFLKILEEGVESGEIDFNRLRQTALMAGVAPEVNEQAVKAAESYKIDDESMAMELFAEHGADWMINGGFDRALRPELGNFLMEHVTRPSFVRNLFSKLGMVVNQDGELVRGTGLFSKGQKRDRALDRVLEDYYKSIATGVTPEVDEATGAGGRGDVQVDPVDYGNNGKVITELFDNSFNVNPDAVNENGKVDINKLFRTERFAAEQQTQVAEAIINSLRGREVEDGAVHILDTDDGSLKVAGRYLDDVTMQAIEDTGVYNDVQLAYLKDVNDLLKNESGKSLMFLYQAALKGRKYKSMTGKWRQEIPYAIHITGLKSGGYNIIVQTVSPAKMLENIHRMWTRKSVKQVWDTREAMVSDMWKYLDNLSNNRPGDTNIGEEKRDILNVATGLKASTRAQWNPMYEDLSGRTKSSFIVSRRLDRMNRMSRVDGEALPFSYQAARRAYVNRHPGFHGSQDADVEITERFRPDQIDTPEFKEWFGDSKVVDAEGNPLVVYHGTGRQFFEFSKGKGVGGMHPTKDLGFFFTPGKEDAEWYSTNAASRGFGEGVSPRVMAVYLKMEKHYDISRFDFYEGAVGVDKRTRRELKERLIKEGYDGMRVIDEDGSPSELIVFSPTQIKSATGNSGAFDPNNPDIRFRPITAAHYSRMKGLVELDPKYHGTGIRGEERARRQAFPEMYLDRIYVGLPGYKKESGLGPIKYLVNLESDSLYDWVNDPDGLQAKAAEIAKGKPQGAFSTAYESVIAEAGYQGYFVDEVAALFGPVPVTEANAVPATIADFSSKNIDGILRKRGWAIMTAENPGAVKSTPEENAARMEKLLKEMRLLGVPAIPVDGMYGGVAEKSVLLLSDDLTYDRAIELANEYDQESVLTPMGLVHQDGSVLPASSVVRHIKKPDDNFTDVNGTYFTIDFARDFGDNLGPETPDVAKLKVETAMFRPDFIEPDMTAVAAAPSFVAQGVYSLAGPLFQFTAARLLNDPGVPEQAPGSMTKVELGRWLEEQFKSTVGRDLAADTPENNNLIAQAIAAEGIQALQEDSSAVGWYDRKLRMAKALATLLYPEIATDKESALIFDLTLAITSNGEAVENNMRIAFGQYEYWKANGKLNEKFREAGRAAAMRQSFKLINELIATEGVDGAIKFLEGKTTPKELAEKGYKAPSGELVDEEVHGSFVFGSKIGNGFFQNLRYNFDPLTMDLWFMRTMNRVTGRFMKTGNLEEGLGKLHKMIFNPRTGKVKTGLSALDKRLVNEAISNSGMTLEDIAGDPASMAEIVPLIESRFQSYYNATKSQGKAPVKSDVMKSVGTQAKNITGQMHETPRNGKERRRFRQIITQARAIVKDMTGTDLTNADFQALIWYPEKRLWRKMGVRAGRGEDIDYTDAIIRILKDRGVADVRITKIMESESGGGSSGNDGRGD